MSQDTAEVERLTAENGRLQSQLAQMAALERIMDAAFAYTVGTGRLFLSMPEFQRRAEWILDRPILTHEFGDKETWRDLREALEESFLESPQQEDEER
jgi:hypothetical protein